MMSNTYAQVRPILGGSLEAGKAYHDIPGEPGPTYRTGSQDRADHIADHIDVDGKYGLDLGCAVGGVSFGLAAHGATMHGIDYDQTSIETAREVALRRSASCTFETADLTSSATWARLAKFEFDFAVWLSNWMWLSVQIGHDAACQQLHELSKLVPILAFETAQGPGDGMAGNNNVVGVDGVRQLLEVHTVYDDIQPIGTGPSKWCGNRTVFVCRR